MDVDSTTDDDFLFFLIDGSNASASVRVTKFAAHMLSTLKHLPYIIDCFQDFFSSDGTFSIIASAARLCNPW